MKARKRGIQHCLKGRKIPGGSYLEGVSQRDSKMNGAKSLKKQVKLHDALSDSNRVHERIM